MIAIVLVFAFAFRDTVELDEYSLGEYFDLIEGGEVESALILSLIHI